MAHRLLYHSTLGLRVMKKKKERIPPTTLRNAGLEFGGTVGGGEDGLRNVQRFRGGLVFKAHRLLYHSTLGLRVIKKKVGGVQGMKPTPRSPGTRFGCTTGSSSWGYINMQRFRVGLIDFCITEL